MQHIKKQQLIYMMIPLVTLVSSSCFATENWNDNPFQYKKEVKPVEATVVAPPDKLSDKQLEEVRNLVEMRAKVLIEKALSEYQENFVSENDREKTINDKRYLILNKDEKLLGITSGMYLIVDAKNNVNYYNAQEYDEVVHFDELKSIVSMNKKRLSDLIKELTSSEINDGENTRREKNSKQADKAVNNKALDKSRFSN
jgi:hypothetical protein